MIPSLRDSILSDSSGCSVCVLKPAVLGGVQETMQLIAQARAAGIATVITHLFDGPVGLAAACEIALANSNDVLACGLDRHAGLDAFPKAPLDQLDRVGGVCVPSDLPGLGIPRAWGDSA
jgi:L-alanine-DL-glutamate epimerase-like enolase superfamily enzyme